MGRLSPELPVPATTRGEDGLAALLAEPARSVVALDFDGTLAPIVPDPDGARAHPGVVPALARLGPAIRAVVIVTGRPAEVAVRYGGFAGVPGLERLTVLGHYGAERWDAAGGGVQSPPPHPGVESLRAELPGFLEGFGAERTRGTRIEDKGRALAVHTRRAHDPRAAFDALRGPVTDLAARHGLIVEPGRLVLELRPPGMDKGVALTGFLREVQAGPVLYAGDDLGDLAAFGAVEKRRADGPPGLLVCSRNASGNGTANGGEEVAELAARADLVVDGPAGVVRLLDALADAVTAGGRLSP
jgi:trehalose 6-phosphate phosphatase